MTTPEQARRIIELRAERESMTPEQREQAWAKLRVALVDRPNCGPKIAALARQMREKTTEERK